MKFILTGGEKSDYQQALLLFSGEGASAVLADKGYAADYIVDEFYVNAPPAEACGFE
jgi:hypothetical protein